MSKEKIRLLNTHVNNFTMQQAADAVEALLNEKAPSYVVAVNVDVVMKMEKDAYLRKVVDRAALTVVDGKPLMWISSLFGRPIKERIAGSDLVPVLIEQAAKAGHSVFLLGGAEGIAEKAKKNMEMRYPGLQVAGIYSPPMGFEADPDEIKKTNEIIAAASPDYLIVCFGCPKQEKYIYENFQQYNAKVSICAGATIDFLAGTVKRAPMWMQNHGLEWFYRFLQEPKRMFRRYFIDDLQIVRLIFKYRRIEKNAN